MCPECKSERVLEGFLMSNYGLNFIVKGTENKFFPEAYKVECKACEDCHAIFDLRIVPKPKKRK